MTTMDTAIEIRIERLKKESPEATLEEITEDAINEEDFDFRYAMNEIENSLGSGWDYDGNEITFLDFDIDGIRVDEDGVSVDDEMYTDEHCGMLENAIYEAISEFNRYQ